MVEIDAIKYLNRACARSAAVVNPPLHSIPSTVVEAREKSFISPVSKTEINKTQKFGHQLDNHRVGYKNRRHSCHI